ncbi:MAG: hypothetical protein KatS3mg061_2121 [Dehalococcoidia bacterium]|nr:MAG: hypothetical protein KatS3mg061_2121 [Dehalococcoidia bacterium]
MNATLLERLARPAVASTTRAWRWPRLLALTATYLLASVALTWPVALDLAGAVPNFGDPLVVVWYLAWYAHALPGPPEVLLNPPIFAPFREALLFHDHLLAQGLLAWPLVRLTGNPVLAANLLLLASFVLAALGGFLLCQRLTGSLAAGGIVGLAVAFSPFRLAHLSHLNLLWLHWLPFALLFLERTLETRRWRDAGLLALFSNLLFFSSYNLAPLGALTLVLWTGVRLATEPRLWGGARHWRRLGLLLGTVGAVTFALHLPLGLRYLAVSERLGFTRTPDEIRTYSATPGDYLVVPPQNALLGRLTAPLRFPAWSERSLFPGLVVIAFALPGAFLALRQGGRARSVALALLVVALVMALVSLGLNTTSLPGLGLYTLLLDQLPALAGLRVPARAGGIVQLALALLAGFALAALLARLRRHSVLLAQGAALALAAGVGIESWSYPAGDAVPVWLGEAAIRLPTDAYPALGQNPTGVTPPSQEVAAWLARTPLPGAVVELPLLLHTERAWLESVRMLAATHHWRPLVNGNGAYRPALLVELSRQLTRFPAADTLAALTGLGVSHVVVHLASYPPAERTQLEAVLASAPLREVARFDDDRIYALEAVALAPATAVRLEVRAEQRGSAVIGTITLENSAPAPFVVPTGEVFRIAAGRASTAVTPPLLIPALGSAQVEFRLPGEHPTVTVRGPLLVTPRMVPVRRS